MPRQRIGIALMALASICAAFDALIATTLLALLGAFLVDE